MQSLPTELSRDYRKYSFAGLVDGRVELSGKMSSGVDLLKSVTLSLSEVRASAENLRAGISGDISYQDQILRSEKLVLQYGDQQAMLQFKAKKSSDNVFRGDFSLSADTLNLNKMLPEQIDEIQVASEDNGGISAPQIQKTLSDDIGPFNLPIDMVGTVVINRLIYKKMNIDRVTANLSLKNNYLVVDNLTSQIGDGQLRGTTIVNFGVKGLAYRGELGLSQSNVMPLVASLFPRLNQSASGALQFQSRFSGHGTIPVNLLRDLQLKGSFGLQNGEIRGSSLLEALASFLGTSDLKVLSFQSLNGQYELQDGLVQLNGQLDSSKVKLAPSGSIDIAGRLNFKLDASFASEILDKLGINKNLKETISGRDGWGNLPLEIRGTLDNPLFSYDSSALQNQIVEKTSQKLVEKNTPDDVEGKESIRKMLDNTLDKLFRK
jgi:AsmA protein